MTNQEAFDKVTAHLLKQQVKSYSQEEGCMYRGPNGTMCAVGCLIPDEDYRPKFEGLSVRPTKLQTTHKGYKELAEAVGKLGVSPWLLYCLQRVHDALLGIVPAKPNLEDTKMGLILVAEKFNLTHNLTSESSRERIQEYLAPALESTPDAATDSEMAQPTT